ncbi:response regulator transcription factor [Sphingomonas sp. CGMCC 1.13654]|uniref:Response regulator transcription factor n=1 Tax=Sphingomonas chungangi TaxID=2683589 RepID=A0A838L6J3_9SPHN|nr:LytTR family DNA-binding domain-containing protein [Sphingomonas chungangi]MBA2934089.1 response regulator transcription factor [Sphingomonas chungangi]MVW57130.1 response regulator [Sphingomonas chungangi]
MRVLLVDDEQLALDRLRVFFGDIENVEVVGEARDGDSAIRQIEELRPDLVILDIQMPGRNGLRTASDIAVDPRPELIFVTAHEHYAPDAFDLEAADYILKPVRFDRLRVATERARRRRLLHDVAARADRLEAEVQGLRDGHASAARSDPELWVPERHGQRRVPIESIDWIEAARDYVLLHTELRSYMLRATMSMLEDKLAGTALIRVHRSAFVRPARVTEIRHEGRTMSLILGDGTAVQVGPSYVEAVEQALGV